MEGPDCFSFCIEVSLPYYSESIASPVDTVGTFQSMFRQIGGSDIRDRPVRGAIPYILGWFDSALLLQALASGLLKIKPQLPKSGRLGRVRARLQIGFLEKVAPT
jgi:hypothetical protein